MKLVSVAAIGAALGLGGACLILASGCNDWDGAKKRAGEEQERQRLLWEGPCKDSATLLATTSGSPSDESCPNKRHHMRVQLSTGPSREEYGALVFCECEREAPAPAAPTPDAGLK